MFVLIFKKNALHWNNTQWRLLTKKQDIIMWRTEYQIIRDDTITENENGRYILKYQDIIIYDTVTSLWEQKKKTNITTV